VSEYDLERAIGLYFETGGADLSGPPPAGPPPEPPQPALHQTPPAGPIIIEDEDEEDLFPSGRGPPAAQNTVDEDEALARQLMQEEIEQQEVHGESSGDGVRSPIASRSDILVHPDTDYDTHQYGYGSRRPGRGIPPVRLAACEMLTFRAHRIPCTWNLQSRETIYMERRKYFPVSCRRNGWFIANE